MKSYKCHKVVQATQIVKRVVESTPHILPSGCAIGFQFDNGTREAFPADDPMLSRYEPVVGDYLVVYPPEGDRPEYRSFSPKAVFEAGYAEIGGKAEIKVGDSVKLVGKILSPKMTVVAIFREPDGDLQADVVWFNDLHMLQAQLPIEALVKVD